MVIQLKYSVATNKNQLIYQKNKPNQTHSIKPYVQHTYSGLFFKTPLLETYAISPRRAIISAQQLKNPTPD